MWSVVINQLWRCDWKDSESLTTATNKARKTIRINKTFLAWHYSKINTHFLRWFELLHDQRKREQHCEVSFTRNWDWEMKNGVWKTPSLYIYRCACAHMHAYNEGQTTLLHVLAGNVSLMASRQSKHDNIKQNEKHEAVHIQYSKPSWKLLIGPTNDGTKQHYLACRMY